MAISAAPWKAHRVVGSSAASHWRANRLARREAKANAAAVQDVFMDVIVVLSVLMFVALAAGVGLLVLQSANVHWPS
jgi:hypothetical protein